MTDETKREIAQMMLELSVAQMEAAERRWLNAVRELEEARGAVGISLRGKREAAGYSLRETAKALGVSAAFLSDVERGNRRPMAAIVTHYVELRGRP